MNRIQRNDPTFAKLQTFNLYLLFYHIFLGCYQAGIHVAALFNPKAKKWIQGRKDIFKKLSLAIAPTDKVVWMHCASLGEFEQGRPLLEAIRLQYPHYKLLLTFFSPSGYEVQKNYTGANWVFYLPLDGRIRAKKFLDLAHPELAIFIKYEFWFFYLKKLSYRKVPLLLVAALFRKEMSFFSWYGSFNRKMASRFNQLFVQNNSSRELLAQIGLGPITTVSGDTRFDRVAAIAKQANPIEVITHFAIGQPLFIAGSTWPEDEKLLAALWPLLEREKVKLIIAPHQISEPQLLSIENNFPHSIRLSHWQAGQGIDKNVLIINSYGLLSSLYQHATLAYIGGGLQSSGIHNVLEAAVYGIPVLFGPNYKKYAEAVDLVKTGGGIPLDNPEDYLQQLTRITLELLHDEKKRTAAGAAAKQFVQAHTGATLKVLHYIQEKRLLIN